MSAGLQPVDLAPRPLGDYAPACGAEGLERLRAAAAPVSGARVLHVSVAAAGGGRVPELLQAALPLALDLGVDVEWKVLFGGPELTGVAAALQNGLQGAETALENGAFADYLEACSAVADGHDAVVVHDPAGIGAAAAVDGPVVWSCHLDCSRPDPPAWERVAPLVSECAATWAPDESFGPPGVRVSALAPGIDPLSPRNLDLAPRLAGRVLRQLGVDLTRPFVCQLMRMDRWKDPHSTLESFALAREELPELQLVLAGALDQEAWPAVKEVSDYAQGQEGVLVLTSYSGVGNLELGALQRLARVGLLRSLREGFGLAASESMWKATPVIGGPGGDVPLQVRDGVDGYITETPEDSAARIVELVRDPGLAIELGRAGRERVRERFLVTRALEDELRLLGTVMRR